MGSTFSPVTESTRCFQKQIKCTENTFLGCEFISWKSWQSRLYWYSSRPFHLEGLLKFVPSSFFSLGKSQLTIGARKVLLYTDACPVLKPCFSLETLPCCERSKEAPWPRAGPISWPREGSISWPREGSISSPRAGQSLDQSRANLLTQNRVNLLTWSRVNLLTQRRVCLNIVDISSSEPFESNILLWHH